MTTTENFQIPLEVAETYESDFVPAIFAEWAPHLLDLADVGPGDHVLDVACGTGIVGRTAAPRVRPDGAVVGVDLNEAMLTVARRVGPAIEWRQGDVTELPFPDGSFDVVVCQMALMFFPDRKGALAEMARVTKDDGTVAVLVPAGLPDQPAYGPFVDTAARHAGPEAMSLLGTYWACGDLDELTRTVESAGLSIAGARTRTGTARFSSPDGLVKTEIESSPLIDRIDADTLEQICADSREVLDPFVTQTGTLDAPLVCHLVAAHKTLR